MFIFSIYPKTFLLQNHGALSMKNCCHWLVLALLILVISPILSEDMYCKVLPNNVFLNRGLL